MSASTWTGGRGDGSVLQTASAKLDLKEPYYRMTQPHLCAWSQEQQVAIQEPQLQRVQVQQPQQQQHVHVAAATMVTKKAGYALQRKVKRVCNAMMKRKCQAQNRIQSRSPAS